MTPQVQITLVAPVLPAREAALRSLLDSMNECPGQADPRNRLLPFSSFEWIHFARLVLLDDALQVDLAAHGVAPLPLPTCLALLVDGDGTLHECLRDLALRADPGLRRLFRHCADFDDRHDLLAWMRARQRPSAASYVNWVGRSVAQIRQEQMLQRALAARVAREPLASAADAVRLRDRLLDQLADEQRAGRLILSPPAPTPLGWRAGELAHAVAVPLAAVLAAPLLLLAAPGLAWLLRRREQQDPELHPVPDMELLRQLEAIEDHEVSNQYSAIGAVKPGRFRSAVLGVLLVAVDYACRHVFTRGHLARVQTIHFARWVFLDGRSRVMFASNYDGSHQGYMDDFINKVAWGLNLVFSNGVGWPRTRWLILGGARHEQRFKRYQRRHQVPTQVWYKAYPGLTLTDLRRNQRIRAGFERGRRMSEQQTLEWLALL